MRIAVVGAGPAGLYFSVLMKKADPSHRITVYERDGADDTFGWGIVFSDQTFKYLRDSDEPSFDRIVAGCETWGNVDVVVRGRKISVHGNRFSGIARLAFLKILQHRAAELGVELQFHANITDPSQLPPSDLVVGADGANSHVRLAHASAFEPEIAAARNKYIWLGTPRLFHGLTLTFHETPWGPFCAHAYKFSNALSTFIVECPPDAWTAAGFESMTERQTCDRLSEIFSSDLEGAPLLTNNFVRWLSFTLVRNRRWFDGRTVLLGDALHTAHFSIGSGTKLALEDAIALAGALRTHPLIDDALPHFQSVRKPVVDSLQDAAVESLHWFENMGQDLELEPIVFAFRLMTRSGRLDKEKLRRRDPAFVAAYERVAGAFT